MEHINRIEIQGRIGTVRHNTVNDTNVVNFSVVTDLLYKGKDGVPVSETTWHQVTAWEGRETQDCRKLEKGTAVNVIGRMRTVKYTNSEGVEKTLHEVLASRLRIIREDQES